MEPSIAGMIVCAGLMALGWSLGAPLVIGTFASLAFGSTAIATLTALGGSSPLINVVFLALLIVAVAGSRRAFADLKQIFIRDPIAWIVTVLCIYVIAGAILLPATFAGAATAFVPSRFEGRVVEVPLTPVSGNITQTAYFLLSASAFFVFRLLLRDIDNICALRRGLFVFAGLHAATGLIDLAAKLGGAGDILGPIRTATYSMLTEVQLAGLPRIVGAHSEASSFGSYSLGCLAFTFTYWRSTGHRMVLALSVVLLVLLVFSTSSTAYAGLAIVIALLGASLLLAFLRSRIRIQELGVVVAAFAALAVVLVIALTNEKAFEPVWALIDNTLLNKSSSASAEERFYWNEKSLQAFFDTAGLGIGIGSSRASSWVIAVVSQLGFVGVALILALLVALLRPIGRPTRDAFEAEAVVVANSLRAITLAQLLAASIGGGSADPGILFFTALAVHTSVRTLVSVNARSRSEFTYTPASAITSVS